MAGIDLNADLGEGFGVWRLGDDDAMLGIVTNANVACGFHAGDPAGPVQVCRAAAQRGVRIGAQVSYRDLAGFGRRFIDIAAEELLADVVYQIGGLQAIAAASGSAVSYVKPHGAPYNAIATHREQAAAVAEAVRVVDATLPVLGLAGSAFFEEASRLGLRTVAEAFADRVAAMVSSGQVTAIDGSQIGVSVESVCVHGDSPGAVQIAAAVRDHLQAAGADIRAFC